MSSDYGWKVEVDWPVEGYIDPDTGTAHAWTDPAPDDDGVVHPEDGYTYQDMVGDWAEAYGMEVAEFLEHLALQRGEVDEKLSPSWVHDGGDWD